MNPSANLFAFGSFNIHRDDWLTSSGGTDRPVNFALIFLSQMTLFRCLAFLHGSLSESLTFLLFWIYLFWC